MLLLKRRPFFIQSFFLLRYRFKADKGIIDALVHLRKKCGAWGRGEATVGESVLATPLFGIRCTDDAGVVSKSPEQLRKMMGVIVVVCAVLGLTLSETKTEIKGMPASTAIFGVEAASQVYNQANELLYLGGNVNRKADLSIELDRRILNAWCSFRIQPQTVRPTERSPRAQIRMLRAEVLEIMLYGGVTWSPRAGHYDTLRRAHHRVLTRYIGW